jgi:hypothetical protein
MRTLTFAAVIAATALHAEGLKPRFEPVEMITRDMYAPPLCRLWNEPRLTLERKQPVFHPPCSAAEMRERMDPIARRVRERLGDPGRH